MNKQMKNNGQCHYDDIPLNPISMAIRTSIFRDIVLLLRYLIL
jgi:hypothetical protein